MKKSAMKHTWALTVSALTVRIIGVFFKVPLLHILGDEGMGYFNCAYTIYAFFYLLCTAGVPKGISILLSEREDAPAVYDKIKKLCLFLFVVLGLFVSVLLIVLSPFLSKAIGNEKAGLTLLVMAPSLFFITVSGVYKGICNYQRNFLFIALSDVIESVCKLSLGLGFAMFSYAKGWALPIVSAFSVMGINVGSMVSCLYLKCMIKNEKNDEKAKQNSDRISTVQILKRLAIIIFPITLSAGINSISNIIDLALIIRRLLFAGINKNVAVSLYGNYTTLVIPIYALGGTISTSISLTALPELCRCKNTSDFRSTFHRYFSSLMFIIIPFSFGLFFFGETALSLLFPSASVMIGAPLLKMIAPAIVLCAAFTFLATALEARGFGFYSFLCVLLGCAGKIIVSYIAIGNPIIGMKGAPIGTLVSCGISLSLGVIFLYRFCDVRLRPVKEFMIPFILAAPAFLAVYAYQNGIAETFSYFQNLLSVFIGGGIYVFCLFLYDIVIKKDSFSLKLYNLQKIQKPFLAKKTNE